MKTKTLTLDLLKELCLQYDTENDVWPGSKFEGHAVFNFVAEKLGKSKQIEEDKWDDELLTQKVNQSMDNGEL